MTALAFLIGYFAGAIVTFFALLAGFNANERRERNHG
jgi:hypothetical protein